MAFLSHCFGRLWRGARDCLGYARYLDNARAVVLARACGKSPPPLRFKSGMVWNHGPYDQPLLLFHELYVDRLLPSVANAPRHATMVDIGANMGAATLFWLAERRDLVVHCYEPNPQAFATLKENVAANRLSDVHLYAEAVGRQAGSISLWVDVPTAFSTSYGPTPSPGGRKVDVPVVTLEQAVERAGGDVWLLKVDTEGAEGEIFHEGSIAALRCCRHIVVEWHDNLVPGVSQVVRGRLAEAGFAVQKEIRHPWDEGIIYAARAID